MIQKCVNQWHTGNPLDKTAMLLCPEAIIAAVNSPDIPAPPGAPANPTPALRGNDNDPDPANSGNNNPIITAVENSAYPGAGATRVLSAGAVTQAVDFLNAHPAILNGHYRNVQNRNGSSSGSIVFRPRQRGGDYNTTIAHVAKLINERNVVLSNLDSQRGGGSLFNSIVRRNMHQNQKAILSDIIRNIFIN